jgi:hypothetical protein
MPSGLNSFGAGDRQGGLAAGVGHDRRQQVGAGVAVGKGRPRRGRQRLAQDVGDPVAAPEQAPAEALVAAGGLDVAGEPAGHGQQLPDRHLPQPRVGVPGEVGGQQLPDTLVQALQLMVGQGDADQRGGNALGDRVDLVAVGGVKALPVALVDQVPWRTTSRLHLRVLLGDLGVQVVQDLRVHALLAGRGGAPPGGGPVVALGWRGGRLAAGGGRPSAFGAAAGGYQQANQQHAK